MSKSNTIEDLVSDVTRALKLAYGRGFNAGGAKMRDTILRAATDLEVPTHEKIAASIRTPAESRVAWGAVSDAVQAILAKEPNLTMTEVEERGNALYPDINTRSFGNQLRRYEGRRYQRDSETDRWSLTKGVTAGP